MPHITNIQDTDAKTSDDTLESRTGRAPRAREHGYPPLPQPRYIMPNTNSFLLKMGQEDVLPCRYSLAAAAEYVGMDKAVAAAAMAVAVAEEEETAGTMPAAGL